MKLIRRLTTVLALWGVAVVQCGAVADEADTIQWSIARTPPFHFAHDETTPSRLIGQGADDLQIAAFERALPGYRHQVIFSSMPRLKYMLDSGEHVCSLMIPTPERLKQFYFTYTEFAAPFVVIARSTVVSRLPLRNGQLSFADLVRDTNLRGLIVAGRSYSPQLDAIALAPAAKGITPISLSANEPNLMHMLLMGRMDYTVEYPSVLKYLQETDSRSEGVTGVPISESHELVRIGAMCPRTSWGRSVISQLDHALPGLISTPEYRASLERWLTEAERLQYRDAIADFYRFRAEPGRSNVPADPGRRYSIRFEGTSRQITKMALRSSGKYQSVRKID
jgi:uncharacterized protein (TIGR02285 family)